MSYVALYRQYRPRSFDEIAGQKVIVKTLKNALKNNQLAHAYLFSGPRGTGKTTIAKIVAKAANCLTAPTDNPCNECSVCKGIDSGDITDVIEIDAASNNGVDEIRELRENAKYAPGVAKFKVYIIDEVHMLSNSAFNALLKTLEEPPKHVIFILATTEIHKIPATIISRCQRFDFKNIEKADIVEKLNEIITEEKITIDDKALELIADDAEGGMRDAISLLDQVRAYKSDKINAEDVLLVSGGVGTDIIIKLITGLIGKNVDEVLTIFDTIIENGKDISRLSFEMINVLKTSLLDHYQEEKKHPELKDLSIGKTYFYLDILNELHNQLRYTNQKRVYFELALLRMIQDPQIEALDLQEQINILNVKINDLINKPAQIIEAPTAVVTQNNDKIPLVTIGDVERILNNANKDLRVELESKWDELNHLTEQGLNTTGKLLVDAEVVATTNSEALLVIKDLITAQTLYREATKERAIRALKKLNNNINDYKCILDISWLQIQEEYIAQFKEGIKKPKLTDRDLHLYKDVLVVKQTTKPKEEEKIVSKAKEYFNEIIIEVEE